MLLLLTQVFFVLCFKACFYLLWSINFCICHLSGQIELTGNRSLKHKGGILYEQKFKLSHPRASRSRWGNGLSSQPRMGTLSCCWGFLDKDRLHVSPSWDGGLPSHVRPATLQRKVPETRSRGPFPTDEDFWIWQCHTQISVVNHCALKVEKTQVAEEGGK